MNRYSTARNEATAKDGTDVLQEQRNSRYKKNDHTNQYK